MDNSRIYRALVSAVEGGVIAPDKLARLREQYGAGPNFVTAGPAQTLHMMMPPPEGTPNEQLQELRRRVEEQVERLQEKLIYQGSITADKIAPPENEEEDMSDDEDDTDVKIEKKFKLELRWAFNMLSTICTKASVTHVRNKANPNAEPHGVQVELIGEYRYRLLWDEGDADWDLWIQNISSEKEDDPWHDCSEELVEEIVPHLLAYYWRQIDAPGTLEFC